MDSRGGLRQRVAGNVRRAMKQAGLSQTQVAGALEVSRTTLFYRLSGARPFNVDELEKLAPLVGREPESFYTQASSEDAA